MTFTKDTTETDLNGVVSDFHELYYRSQVWQDTQWLGVPVLKCPFDLWSYQEILAEDKPDLVVETGTFRGGSALFLATVMDILGRGEVLSIDLERRAGLPNHPRITYLAGLSSTTEEVLAEVRRRAAGKRVMVVLDSDHSDKHVTAELAAYSGFVSPGSYLVVEDTNVTFADNGGACAAASRFVGSAEGAAFEVDDRRERFFLTFNPRGWLRRRGGVS